MLTRVDVQRGVDHCVDVLCKKLNEFDCAQDYLILVGDPILMGVATVFANQMCDGLLTVLQWDSLNNEYQPIDIKIP